jgi:hypothetical protein
MNYLQTYFPFGPPIGHIKLPDELTNDLNKGCDDIIKDKELSKSQDWSHNLVGQVEQELLIPKDIINKWIEWFGIQLRSYVSGYLDQFNIPEQNIISGSKEQKVQAVNKVQLNIKSAWYIRSFAGDYNPIHTHRDCELTCVGFLKVPDLSGERRKSIPYSHHTHGPHGVLEILSSNGSTDTVFYENDTVGLTPKVGNWYLFPANLRHTVYPFKSDGERRSFSINMNTNMFKNASET